LIDELGELGGPSSEYKIYTSEIQGCLSVGLLLAALSVSTSMLELFVRDLAVACRLEAHYAGDMKLKSRVEREIEEDRQVTLNSMLKELELTVITPKDSEALACFYRKTRIPIAHALVRRMTRDKIPLGPELMDILHLRSRDVEERLEDVALPEIKFVLETVKNYRPWLLRRYKTNS
jgi:hypothetical protein